MPDAFYHVNDVSVCLGRQRGGGVPDRNWTVGRPGNKSNIRLGRRGSLSHLLLLTVFFL